MDPHRHLEPIRKLDELHDYTSCRYDEPAFQVTYQIREMLAWVTHHDRVMWAVRTKDGRVIVVMQQRHDGNRAKVATEIELINAPFPSSAVVGLREEVEMFQYVLDIVAKTGSL
jgi:hypothetical protein